ncbi:hypothetical protein CGZ80_15870 [Rhodopirellula sp. MGV]|nr:hypothetical protein CGZ80_15870 [Rhodopirellula sp. MGV]PNY33573.1 hypothetical protein C2E31_27595 [Rhodopirellula baltica]
MERTPLPRSNKGKSARRWTDGRRLQDEVIPTLPNAGCVAVFWACWFNAEYTERGHLVFDLTSTQLAPLAGQNARSVERHLQTLTNGGVFATRKGGCNKGGRALGAERRITFQPFKNLRTTA